MATPAQIAANRANAQKSTGPRTPEGREKTRFNAFKHGLSSELLVINHEDKLAYHELRGDLYKQYQPVNGPECMLVDQLASAWWRTMRVRAIETDMLQLQIDTLERAHKHEMGPIGNKKRRQGVAVRFVSEDPRHFQNFLRYDAAIDRAFYRALNALEKMQKDRLRADAQQPTRLQRPEFEPSDDHFTAPDKTPVSITTKQTPNPEIGSVLPIPDPAPETPAGTEPGAQESEAGSI